VIRQRLFHRGQPHPAGCHGADGRIHQSLSHPGLVNSLVALGPLPSTTIAIFLLERDESGAPRPGFSRITHRRKVL